MRLSKSCILIHIRNTTICKRASSSQISRVNNGLDDVNRERGPSSLQSLHAWRNVRTSQVPCYPIRRCLLHCPSQVSPSPASKHLRGTKIESPISVAVCNIPFTSCPCEHFLSRTHLKSSSYNVNRDLPIVRAHLLPHTDPTLLRFSVFILAFCSGGLVFFLLSVSASPNISFSISSPSATQKSQCSDITPHTRRTSCLPHYFDRENRASLFIVLFRLTRRPRSSGASCAKMRASHLPSPMTI